MKEYIFRTNFARSRLRSMTFPVSSESGTFFSSKVIKSRNTILEGVCTSRGLVPGVQSLNNIYIASAELPLPNVLPKLPQKPILK